MAGDVLEERVSGIGTDGLPALEELQGRGAFGAMRTSRRIGLNAGSLQVIGLCGAIVPRASRRGQEWSNFVVEQELLGALGDEG